MNHETVGKLIDRWINEPAFRGTLKKDPEGTLKKTGIQMTDEEWAAIRRIDWKLSDDELKNRLSKLFV